VFVHRLGLMIVGLRARAPDGGRTRPRQHSDLASMYRIVSETRMKQSEGEFSNTAACWFVRGSSSGHVRSAVTYPHSRIQGFRVRSMH
jgi:hypothetical protein